MYTATDPTNSSPPVPDTPAADALRWWRCGSFAAAWAKRTGRPLVHALAGAALLVLALTASACQVEPAQAADHIWSETTCEAPTCVGRCCSKKCMKYCTVCLAPRIWSETSCTGADEKAAHDHGAAPLWEGKGGKFGGGGATGGFEDCPPHDMGPEECGPWSSVGGNCKIKHCTKKCRKCQGNFGDYFRQDPPGCFD